MHKKPKPLGISLETLAKYIWKKKKEFLRKEDQEQNQDFEKDESQQIKSENEDVDSIIQLGENDDAKPRKAWTTLAKNGSNTNLVPILTVMGKFCLNFCALLRKLNN